MNPSPYQCNDVDDDDEDSEDDLIPLTGLDSYSNYRFPLIKYCPLPSCLVLFGVRSDAITHFRKKHSTNAVLCPLCKKPLLVPEIELHYQETHPKHDIPANFNQDSESSTEKSFKRAKVGTVHTFFSMI